MTYSIQRQPVKDATLTMRLPKTIKEQAIAKAKELKVSPSDLAYQALSQVLANL